MAAYGESLASTYKRKNNIFSSLPDELEIGTTSSCLGLLEVPNVPLSVQQLKYKVFVAGRAGIGKSFLISWLSGLELSSFYQSTPGTQMTVVHCSVNINHSAKKEFLFTLQLWETGASGRGLNSSLNVGCPAQVDGVILIFPYKEKEILESLPGLMESFTTSDSVTKPCFIAIGACWNLHELPEISVEDLSEFESKWNIPVINLPNISSRNSQDKQKLTELREHILQSICEKLWHRDQHLVASGEFCSPAKVL